MAINISKDYYKILEVGENASAADIKKSYRRLAMKHHPDKNANTKDSELKFKDLQEAYHVLSNEKRRQQYNHARFDRKHGLNKKPSADVTNIDALVKKAAQLKKKVEQMDPHRINKDGLFNSIELLLSVKNMNIIKVAEHEAKSANIVQDLLECSRPLLNKQVKEVCIKLSAIAATRNSLQQHIFSFEKSHKASELWQTYNPLIAIVCVIIFCILIYMIST